MNVNFEYYKVFYYVAKNNSISQAASQLHLTQPTISHYIKSLENELRVTLFTRTSHGMVMTEEAKVIFDNIKHAVAHIEKAKNDLISYASLNTGTIYTIVNETGFFTSMLPVISEFHQKYPYISINISGDTSLTAIERLKDGLADFIIITDCINNLPSNMTVHNLETINDIFVCGEKYLPLTQEPHSIQELMSYPLVNNIIHQPSSGYSREVSSYYINNHINVDIISNELYFYKRRLLIAGLGIGIMPSVIVADDIKEGILHKINTTTALPPRYVYLVYKNDRVLNPSAKELIRLITEHIKD